MMNKKVKVGRVFGHKNAKGELYYKGKGTVGSRKIDFIMLPCGVSSNGSLMLDVFITDAFEQFKGFDRLERS